MNPVTLVTENDALTENDIVFVSELAIEAGLLAARMREGVSVKEKTGPHDRVTAADFALSKLIVERLTGRFPNDAVVSEEDEKHLSNQTKNRIWLVDPIDGTDNYISNDGQYSVMIGLLLDLKPIFGWVFAPATKTIYYGGPKYGAWKKAEGEKEHKFAALAPIDDSEVARVVMGYRDRTANPWVKEHPKVVLVKAGSIGLKVARVLEEQADIFVHLSAALKTWDTCGPTAIALGGGLDVGSMQEDFLSFPSNTIKHATKVIIGRPGALKWSRKHLTGPTNGSD